MWLVTVAASAQIISSKDTIGPDHFWFTQTDFYVARGHTNAAAWVDFYPGNQGWVGNVCCQTANDTAVTPADYDAVSNRLYFSYTHRPIALNIPIHCDTNTADDKTIDVYLSNPSGYPTGEIDSPGSALVHLIANTNGNVAFAQQTQYTSRAGEAVRIRLVRSGPPNGSIVVRFATDPGQYDGYSYDVNVTGNAGAGTDFVATNGALNFGPGETEHSFDLTVLPSGATNIVWRNLYLMEDYGPDFHITNNRMTVVMVPPTALSVQQLQNAVQISWTNYGADLALERSADPSFSQPIQISYTTNGDQCVATEPISVAGFYRLKR